jgi:hypothetical protein
MPVYGDKVTEYFNPIMMDGFYKSNYQYPWPRFVEKEDSDVFINDKIMSPAEAVASFLPGYA